jgi:uncharacterized membrane protein YidH (DUF202 family)
MTGQPFAEDDVAIKTYRYLRIGMVVLVLLIASSVIIEAVEAKCLQTSISAYYYTPVQAILVGGLMAIGVCLIVIKGSTPAEDLCLNLAGMLAPIVAVVPTSEERTNCVASTRLALPGDWVTASYRNNVEALLIAGFAGLLIAFVVAGAVNNSAMEAMRRSAERIKAGLWTVLAVLLIALILFMFWDSFGTRAHGFAAFLMFVFLAASSAINWRELRGQTTKRKYRRIYGIIAAAMIAVGVVVLLFLRSWSYHVLVLEGAEIVLFATFWLNQTAEHWDETVRPTASSKR